MMIEAIKPPQKVDTLTKRGIILFPEPLFIPNDEMDILKSNDIKRYLNENYSAQIERFRELNINPNVYALIKLIDLKMKFPLSDEIDQSGTPLHTYKVDGFEIKGPNLTTVGRSLFALKNLQARDKLKVVDFRLGMTII